MLQGSLRSQRCDPVQHASKQPSLPPGGPTQPLSQSTLYVEHHHINIIIIINEAFTVHLLQEYSTGIHNNSQMV